MTPGDALRPRGARVLELSRETLEGVRRRDPEALSALFEHGFDRVYSLAARLLGDPTAAQDAAQEVFLKVYRAAHQLDPARDPFPWLTAITVNVCRDHWRSKEARASVRATSIDDDESSAREMLASNEEDPEARVLGMERDRLVQEAILALPEEIREVVLLRDYQGLSHEEIAGVVGASHAAVRKRYSRALARLAELLKDMDV